MLPDMLKSDHLIYLEAFPRDTEQGWPGNVELGTVIWDVGELPETEEAPDIQNALEAMDICRIAVWTHELISVKIVDPEEHPTIDFEFTFVYNKTRYRRIMPVYAPVNGNFKAMYFGWEYIFRTLFNIPKNCPEKNMTQISWVYNFGFEDPMAQRLIKLVEENVLRVWDSPEWQEALVGVRASWRESIIRRCRGYIGKAIDAASESNVTDEELHQILNEELVRKVLDSL